MEGGLVANAILWAPPHPVYTAGAPHSSDPFSCSLGFMMVSWWYA